MMKKFILLSSLLCMPLCQARINPDRLLFIGLTTGFIGLFFALDQKKECRDKKEPSKSNKNNEHNEHLTLLLNNYP